MCKKRILYLSDAPMVNTGFGGVSKKLLSSFFKSKKYQILHLCQGLQENNPEFIRFPWKCKGTIPYDQNIINKMNQDPHFGRLVSYGEAVLEKNVLEFKPDIVITINDPWGSSDIGVKFKFWNKTHCIGWETIDSIPLYQPVLDHIDKLKNLYCWSSFAEEEFHRLGHKHVKTVFPPLDTKSFYPLPKNKKIELKKYLGINDKKFIVSYVFRNQLRKQSWVIIDGYSKLSKKYPEIAKDVYLHFHTHLKEGWDHKRFCLQYGVDYNRILFTWICKNCRNIQIKSDNGNENCQHCKSEKSLETCSVGFGATIEQMNYIYNIGDCFTLVANSGATEIPGIEAMSCGLPLATIDYTYGHDFCKNNFVYNLNFTKYVEFGTQFIKATPSSDDICEFIKKIYTSNDNELDLLSQKSREWVVTNFDTEVISNKWQNIFDNLPEVTWNFEYEKIESKNPNIPIPNIPDNKEFIKFLYNNLLKVEVDTESEDFKSWITRLEGGRPREEIIGFFKDIALKDNQSIQKQFDFNDLLVNNGKKNYLILCKEAYGDCLTLSALLKSFRENYLENEWNLYIGCDTQYKEVFDGNPYITKVLDYRPEMENEIIMTGHLGNKGFFDGYTHLTVNTQRHLSYLKNNNIGIKLDLNCSH